jgi:hypothetical protein
MLALLCLFLRLASRFKSMSRLEAENTALRQQLIVLQRKVRGRVAFIDSDRLFFILLYRLFPSILNAMTIIRPETLVRWHRAGFLRYWRWKSRNPGGRPPIRAELRALIRRMSIENVLWGAPRIQGELLRLGFAVAQSTVAKYMAKRDDPALSNRPDHRISCRGSQSAHPVRPGAPFCATMRRTSPQRICLWFRPSALSSCTCW